MFGRRWLVGVAGALVIGGCAAPTPPQGASAGSTVEATGEATGPVVFELNEVSGAAGTDDGYWTSSQGRDEGAQPMPDSSVVPVRIVGSSECGWTGAPPTVAAVETECVDSSEVDSAATVVPLPEPLASEFPGEPPAGTEPCDPEAEIGPDGFPVGVPIDPSTGLPTCGFWTLSGGLTAGDPTGEPAWDEQAWIDNECRPDDEGTATALLQGGFEMTSFLIRTDFSSADAWEQACVSAAESVEQPDGQVFRASLDPLQNKEFHGKSVKELVALATRAGYQGSVLFVADSTTMTDPERSLLVIDLWDEPGRTFRVVPGEMWAVENNLSIANMDFADFADSVDPDGTFRGF